MRNYFKRIASWILIPITRWYLAYDRTYRYKDISVKVFSGVFHPGLFPSTKFLISYLEEQDLNNSTLLELGCGTGLISVVAAKKGAKVLASDLNQKAFNNCKQNAIQNNITLDVYHSDLFQNLPQTKFDWIVINPPYYAKPAKNDEELAWHCGENFEYFQRLFAELGDFIHDESNVIMVLTVRLDIDRIKSFAKNYQFQMELKREQNVLFDGVDLIFKISKIGNPILR